MEHHIIKIMSQFKDNIIKAGMLAVKEVLYSSYEFEVVSITFNIDYSETTENYEFYSCDIKFNYGNPKGDPWYRENSISINNIPEYKLDDINYLYGVFCGYFCKIEQIEEEKR